MVQPLGQIDGQELARVVNQVQSRGSFPGSSVTVLRNDRLSVNSGVTSLGGNSIMRADTRFPIGCIAEVLLTQVGATLERKRFFNWDEPIHCYLSEVRASSPLGRVTGRQLLIHSSGLDYQPKHIHHRDPTDIRPYLDTGVLFSPGLFMSRSLCNSRLLHLLFETIERDSVETYVRETLQVTGKDLFRYDTRGSTYDSSIKQLGPVEDDQYGVPTIERLAFSSAQLAQLGRAYSESFLQRADGSVEADSLCSTTYVVQDTPDLALWHPPLFLFMGVYVTVGHFMGHNLYLLIMPESGTTAAICVNSNSGALFYEIARETIGKFSDGRRLLSAKRSESIYWHVCTERDSISGSYAAHGMCVQVSSDGTTVRMQGSLGHWPARQRRDSLMFLAKDGVFVTPPSMLAHRREFARATFISLVSTNAKAQYLRLNNWLLKRKEI